MRPYPGYRDSGIEWVGEVPEHWAIDPVKRWFEIVNGGTPASGNETFWDGEIVWLTPDDLGQSVSYRIERGRRTITEEGLSNSSARLTPAGSVVVSTRAPIGHIAITATDSATNQGCRTLVPSPRIENTFAYYACVASRSVLESLGQGSTFMELTPASLGSLRLPVPPLDEQREIADFLDRETGRIDLLIAKKRLLIERLREYRTALITRSVTRGLPPEAARAAGLDPSPRLKPSGVEWLGDVPAHWEVHPFKQVCRLTYGDSLTSEARDEGEVAVFGSNGEVGSHSSPNTSGPVIVIGRKGSHGEVNFSSSPVFAIDTTYFVDDRYTTANIRWLYYTLGSTGLADFSKDSAVPGLSRDDAYAKHLPLPPLKEQGVIAEYLDTESQRIDHLLGRVEEAIDRFREYRTALITAAVTGKIDVRDAASSDRGSVELPV